MLKSLTFGLFQLLEHFIEEYFDQNPISQLGIITTKNKRAEKVTELGGNIKIREIRTPDKLLLLS